MAGYGLGMVFETGALDSTLSAAAGEDPALFAELRAAFVDSLSRQVDLLGRARCDGNWQITAMRLRGLGASFQAWPLVTLADEALAAAPGEPVILRRLQEFLRDVAGAPSH